MINDKLYQMIFDEIKKCLHIKWDKLIVYLEYGEASYSFSFYVKQGHGYVKCYDLPGINDAALDSAFAKINAILTPERDSMGIKRWSNMTMIVDNNGAMHTDLDYSDLSGGVFEYKKAWKAKYLV